MQNSNGQGGIWLHTLGQYAKQKQQRNKNGFSARAAGAMAGRDRKCSSQSFIGGGVGLSQTSLVLNHSAGNGHIRSYYGMLYGTYFTGPWHFDLSAVAALSQFKMNRVIHVPTLAPRTASNAHKGYELAPHLGLGYELPIHDYILEPFIGADYVFQKEESYHEQGAQSLNCYIRSRRSSLLRTETGVNLTKAFKFNDYTFTLQGKLSYIYKRAHNMRSTASLRDQQGNFTLNGGTNAQHQFSPGIEGYFSKPEPPVHGCTL